MTMLHLLPFLLAALGAPHIGDIIAPGATLQVLANGFGFTEGSISDKKGNVYFTDQPNNRILRWNVDGSITQWLQPSGRSNGMWFDKKGNLITCADENNQLWRISPTQETKVLIHDWEGKLLNGPNDVWVRPDGGMYITDPLYVRTYWTRDPACQTGTENVFFLSKDYKVLKPVDTAMKRPNGIIGSPDGKILYVSDIDGGVTYKYKMALDGTLLDKTEFCKFGSDGMTMDDEGNVYCTGKGVTVFNKEGKQIEHIDVPEAWVGHVAFGGRDHRMLFIAASHGIYGLKMRVRGAY
jgi:gluconolactonase